MATLTALESKYFPTTPGVLPHSGDTEVIPHVDGNSYLDALAAAIDATTGAGDVIYLVNWLLVHTTKIRTAAPVEIGTLLAEKAAAGADVRVILWTGRSIMGRALATGADEPTWWENTGPFGIGESFMRVVRNNIDSAIALRALKVLPGTTTPLEGRVLMDWGGEAVGSRHQKYAVVYSKTSQDSRAFVGMDIDPKKLTSPGHVGGQWHDAGVELRGAAVASVWADFKTRWDETLSLPAAQFRLSGLPQFFNPPTPASIAVPPVPSPATATVAPLTSTSSVRIVRNYNVFKYWPLFGSKIPWATPPLGGGDQILPLFLKAIGAATQYIYIEDQALNQNDNITPHNSLFPAIAAAANRGVKVIFVCPGEPTGGTGTPAPLMNSSWAFSLDDNLGDLISSANALNFVMYRVDFLTVHSKLILIDDEFVSVGSANFFDRSVQSFPPSGGGADTELSAGIVDTTDLVKKLRVTLWADHLRVDPTNAPVAAELSDLNKSLGFFRPTWGTGVTFAHPDSKFTIVNE